MNLKVTLAKRENEIAECVAWGGSYKETASLLQISVRTVDNTLRKVKEKLGLNKINEISAWWFCTHHNISLTYPLLLEDKYRSYYFSCSSVEKLRSLQTQHIQYVVLAEHVLNIESEDRKLLLINHILFNQITHKECVRDKPGILVIHFLYSNEEIEVYHY